MTTDLADDEELTFDAERPARAEPEAPRAPEPAKAESPDPAPATQAAADTPRADAEAEPPKAKRSLTGMMVAAGFAVCIIASVTSAVMAWRAASLVAAAHEGTAGKSAEARLAYMQRLLEQQRDALDGLSARPGAAAVAGGDDGQMNALAAAVKANQEMNERLPSIIMQQVDRRLAGRPAAQRPATASRPAKVKVASVAPKSKAAKTAQVARPVAPLPLQPIAAPVVSRRPAGEAIRYP